MKFANPMVSILTPTWNRGAYLERVWSGLNSQTYKNIEWIVCNDGSTDDTAVRLRDLASKASFRVTIITASVRIGKARMDNEGVARARGEFILWNDSDDYLLPEAIERLVAVWNSIPEDKQAEYVGITALCTCQSGVIASTLLKQGQFDTTWNNLSERLKIAGDMVYFTKASALKAHPFPEVDFVVPEGVIWTSIGDMKVRMHPEVMKVVEYRAPNCISFSGKMEYCRGRAYAMAVSVRNLRSYPSNMKARLWKLITYLRYSIHGEVEHREAWSRWGENSFRVTLLLMFPIAYLLVLKDRFQRKVRKTHREFLIATKDVVITCMDMGDRGCDHALAAEVQMSSSNLQSGRAE